MWSQITFDLGKMTTDKTGVKTKKYCPIFLKEQFAILYPLTQTQTEYMHSDENKKWLFQEWPQQSFAFLVAGRYGIPTTGMNMAMNRVALIII